MFIILADAIVDVMKYIKISKCIFCGNDSSNSKSVEHIVPESLGNDKWILERGIVCDKCNNYFSREIENIVLNLPGFKQLRFYNLIDSKKGKIPSGEALIASGIAKLDWKVVNGMPCIMMGIEPSTFESIKQKKPKMFIVKGAYLDDNEHKYDISRFIYKIAFEFLVYSYLEYFEQEKIEVDELLFPPNLIAIRDFVRKGNREKHYLKYNYSLDRNIKTDPFETQYISIGSRNEDEYLIMDIKIINSVFTIKIKFDKE